VPRDVISLSVLGRPCETPARQHFFACASNLLIFHGEDATPRVGRGAGVSPPRAQGTYRQRTATVEPTQIAPLPFFHTKESPMLKHVVAGSLITCAVALSTGADPALAHCSRHRKAYVPVAPLVPWEYIVPAVPSVYEEPYVLVHRHKRVHRHVDQYVTVHRPPRVDKHVHVHRPPRVDQHVNVHRPDHGKGHGQGKGHGHGTPRGQRRDR
jgi:hypothetical protein